MNFELTTFWVNILLPILSILIPVFATLYTVNNRIKAQNKENHQPYVVLDSVFETTDDGDKHCEIKFPTSVKFVGESVILKLFVNDTLKDTLEIVIKSI